MKRRRLGWELLFGPITPYQFRLRGPGASPKEARRNVLTAWVLSPFPSLPSPSP